MDTAIGNPMQKKLEQVRKSTIENFAEKMDCYLDTMDSPIEKLFYMAACKFILRPEYLLCSRLSVLENLSYQVKVGKYTVDFVLCMLESGTTKIAVELDGHDFHEKTKEQAAHDKAKDRFLQAKGYHVARFTGAEVFRDPDEVFWKVENMWIDIHRRTDLERAAGASG